MFSDLGLVSVCDLLFLVSLSSALLPGSVQTIPSSVSCKRSIEAGTVQRMGAPPASLEGGASLPRCPSCGRVGCSFSGVYSMTKVSAGAQVTAQATRWQPV